MYKIEQNKFIKYFFLFKNSLYSIKWTVYKKVWDQSERENGNFLIFVIVVSYFGLGKFGVAPGTRQGGFLPWRFGYGWRGGLFLLTIGLEAAHLDQRRYRVVIRTIQQWVILMVVNYFPYIFKIVRSYRRINSIRVICVVGLGI